MKMNTRLLTLAARLIGMNAMAVSPSHQNTGLAVAATKPKQKNPNTAYRPPTYVDLRDAAQLKRDRKAAKRLKLKGGGA
jgi:hypothetical protein